MKVAIFFGTRPEIIKLCMLSKKMAEKHDVTNIFTGQHYSLYEDYKHLIKIDHKVTLPECEDLNFLYAALTFEINQSLKTIKPDLSIVQGDTASSYCAALCSFMMGIKVGHVEAGLRTNDLLSPFPEEFNRQAIGKISSYNWCPTKEAIENLRKENINGKVFLTGNTIVDFISSICDTKEITRSNEVIVTLHRRENKDLFEDMLRQLNKIAIDNKNLKFIFPVHPNPIIQKQVEILKADNIELRQPMPYEPFVRLLRSCRAIITDSGGIQEEAVCLKKKVLICRNNTEREEGVNIGICRIVGTNIVDNFKWLLEDFSGEYDNPYGSGDACDKIIKTLEGLDCHNKK